MSGLAALAVGLSVDAYAQPANSDLWIGFENSDNGFLVDEDSGNIWMTGICLKPLAKATRQGTVWTSNTVELVSVGSVMAVLDQTFELQTSASAAEIAVKSPHRGGEQRFAAKIDRNCTSGGDCARLIASQTACNG